MAYAENRTSNSWRAIPILMASRMKLSAMLASCDLRCAAMKIQGCAFSYSDAVASYQQLGEKRGGDDCGVCITVRVPADANVPSCPVVDLRVPRGAKKGHDAGAMVRALREMPGWRDVAAI